MQRTKPPKKSEQAIRQEKITLLEQVKNINQAIRDKKVSRKELTETQTLIWATEQMEPDLEKQAEARRRVQANAPSPTCRKMTELGHMTSWLERLADGRIKIPKKDKVWVEAIIMKGPNLILQFHKLGVDLKAVNAMLRLVDMDGPVDERLVKEYLDGVTNIDEEAKFNKAIDITPEYIKTKQGGGKNND